MSRRKQTQSEFDRETADDLAAAPPAVPGLGKLPAYEQIKHHVLQGIADGTWKSGELIPSEAEMVKQFGVARMTVSRALRELAAEHVLTRVQGAGTFVSGRQYESTLVEIRSIADEIAERGHRHTAQVLALEPSDDAEALEALKLSAGPVYHSKIVHFENNIPIQYEDRYVNPLLFPHYLEQDFTRQTPNRYMMQVAPLQHAEYRIFAQKPQACVRRRLAVEIGEPCLALWRRTWVGNAIATSVTLWHPGSRFQFSGSL